ncbi:MAG: HEAT repeat domain-containing protein [Candidatus Saccharibacteria bacterium]
MSEKFSEMLVVGGHANSLGRVNDIIELVLDDESRLDELYSCLFDEDAWVRMRAADALEKICRQHSDWLQPYINKFQDELATSAQPSIQWHMAQIYREVDLTDKQKQRAISWLKQLLSTKDVDWIVAANAMDTLVQFTKGGFFPRTELAPLLKVQQQHKSNAVVRRANKLLAEL